VVLLSEGGLPAICRIAAVGNNVAILNDRGRVEIQGSGTSLILPSGKYARLEAGRPQAAGQLAGKVAAAIPAETVQHVGQTQEIQLKIQDAVNWEDLIRTLQTGRVRIALLDNSFLNIGARSVMRVTKHDPQTQQTEVELTLGRLRGEVVKLTKPGASLQVRTQTAVIGVVGTIFFVEALQALTRVTCIDGVLAVRNINPSVPGEISLKAGQSTTVKRNQPPANASNTSSDQLLRAIRVTHAGEPLPPPVYQALGTLNVKPDQLQALVNELSKLKGTEVSTLTGQPTGVTTAARQVPGAAAQGANATTSLVNLATGAASAGLSGVAISRVTDAKGNSGKASSDLSSALAASQAATAAANAVAAAAPLLPNILSPSQPCACE
jgi:hypothetical protein